MVPYRKFLHGFGSSFTDSILVLMYALLFKGTFLIHNFLELGSGEKT